MQTSPFNIFEISLKRRVPWSFQVNERKKARKEGGAIQYLNINIVSQVEMQNCIKSKGKQKNRKTD